MAGVCVERCEARRVLVPYRYLSLIAYCLSSSQVYLERCEAHRVLPLSTCIQSVIRPHELSDISRDVGTSRHLGDPSAPSLQSKSRVQKDGEGGKEEAGVDEGAAAAAVADAAATQEGLAPRDESIVSISLRHYAMSAAGVSAVITWLRSRAQQALLPDEGSEGGGGGCGSGDSGRQRIRLDLSGNGLRAGDSEALLAELGVVLHLPDAAAGISELDLSRNGIGEHAHLLFPGALTGVTTSRGGGIGSQAAIRLAPTHTLTTLELSDVGLGEPAAPALARALADNQTLTALSLSKNLLGSNCAQALAEQMQVRPASKPWTI